MGRFEATASTWVKAPPQQVWDFVTSNDDWRTPWVTEVEPLSDGPLRPGSQFENHLTGGGKDWTVVNEMTTVDAPNRLCWVQSGHPDGPTRTIEGSYLLSPERGGTRFTLTGTYETTGNGPGPGWLNRLILQRRVFPRYAKNLQREFTALRA